MAIELILTNKRLLRHPLWMVALGIAAVTIAIFLSWKIFPGSSSLVLVSFTIIPLIPLMVKLIEHEEYVHAHSNSRRFFHMHSVSALAKSKVLLLYSYLFIGLLIGFLVWTLILPSHVSSHIFSQQNDALYDFEGPGGFATYQIIPQGEQCDQQAIQPFITNDFGGCQVADFDKDGVNEYILYKGAEYDSVVYASAGSYDQSSYGWYLFMHILQNNFIVLLFVFMTSFIYGTGALFILTWNASIIAFFFSEILAGKFSALLLFTTFFHGVPEMLGFLMASLSGGIVSVAFIRHKFMDKSFRQVFRDAFAVFTISLLFLVVGAGIEVL